MSVEKTARELILEEIIIDLVKQGVSLTPGVINEAFNSFTEGKDLSLPLLSAVEFAVSSNEISSAIKFNNMTDRVRKDLTVAYTELFNVIFEDSLESVSGMLSLFSNY